MKDLPILVKPYYTIEEAYNRLKSVGAHLDKVEDVLLLARSNMIEVKLLCDEHITFSDTKYTNPILLGLPDDFSHGPDDLSHGVEGLLEEGYTHEQIDEFIREAKVPSFWVEGFSSNLEGAAYRHLGGRELPIMIKPLDVSLVLFGIKNKQLRDADWLAENKEENYNFETLAAFEWNGESFYVCDGGGINPAYPFTYGSVNIDGEEVECELTYALDTSLIERLLEKENIVIEKAEIQRFEQEHLNISHGVSPKDVPDYADPNNSYYAKELVIAIEAHTAIFINGKGNQYKSAGERVKTWLSENYPKASNAFYERIATVILPK